MISQQEYKSRREKILKAIPKNAVAFVLSAPEIFRTGDTHYSYRQNSDFYYLTGFDEPEAILVLIPGYKDGEYILFNRRRDPAKEIWDGYRAGQEGAVSAFGADKAYPIDMFLSLLPELLADRQRVYYPIGKNETFHQMLMTEIDGLRAKVRRGMAAPTEFYQIEPLIHEMRLIKSKDEIAIMRKAGQISTAAHIRAIKACKPEMYEYELEAELMYEFYRQGCRSVAYSSIIGSGENTCILHYNSNNKIVKDGDLVLIDAGGEYENYSSDVTRTFPANGKFSKEQAAIYNLVLKAQLAALELIKPGIYWWDIQECIFKIYAQGLVELGVVKGTPESLLASNGLSQFYMHNSGHWLGLDTHDVGMYKVNGQWRQLVPGMVLTIEPGIYISANTPGVDAKWWNIGVRIEDDVVVTEQGNEVLTAGLPKTIAEIEALMAK